MSTTPIIIETQANLAGLISTKQGLQELEPATAAATKGFERVKESAQEFGSAEEYVNRMNTRMKAAFDENIAGSTEMGYSVREARGAARMLGDELGVHLNRELSGTLARSELLGPMLEKAFNALAIVGFIDIAVEAIRTMSEWADITLKDAEVQDTFERALNRSTDQLNQMKERAAALVGPLAEAAQRAADYASRSLDLTTEFKDLNDALDHGPSLWTDLKEAIGTAVVYTEIFLGKVDPATLALQKFNETTAQSVKQQQDLGPAIDKVRGKIEELQRALAADENAGPLESFYLSMVGQTDRANYALEEETKIFNSMLQQQKTFQQEQAINQQQGMETLAQDRATAAEAHIEFEEAQARELIKLHQASYEQELSMLQKFEDQKYHEQISAITAKQSALKTLEKTNPNVDHANEEKALEEQLHTLREKYAKANLDLVTTEDEEVSKRDEALAAARIDAEYRVAEATNKLEDSMAKRMLAKAQDVQQVLAAQKSEVDAINSSYDAQFDKVMQLARVQEKELPGPMRSTLGTQAYGEELKQYDTLAPEIVAKLTDLNAQMIALTSQRTEAIDNAVQESTDRQEALQKQALETNIADLNAQVQQTKSAYSEQSEALKAMYQQRSITASDYLSRERALDQQEYQGIVATLEKEAEATSEAANKKVITEQEASKRLTQIYAQESQAWLAFLRQDQSALDQNVQKMQQKTESFFQTFNSGITRMMTSNESFLKMMTGVWNNLATTFANNVLKMVEQWSVGELMKLTVSKASNAELTADTLTQNVVKRLDNAKTAATAAMASVGFPLDLIVGPVVFAATLAFEQGGIVPGSKGSAVPIMAHAREMVLPEHISTFVQDAAAMHSGMGTTPVSQSNTVHNHNNFELHVHGGQTDKDDVISWVNEGIKAGSVSYR